MYYKLFSSFLLFTFFGSKCIWNSETPYLQNYNRKRGINSFGLCLVSRTCLVISLQGPHHFHDMERYKVHFYNHQSVTQIHRMEKENTQNHILIYFKWFGVCINMKPVLEILWNVCVVLFSSSLYGLKLSGWEICTFCVIFCQFSTWPGVTWSRTKNTQLTSTLRRVMGLPCFYCILIQFDRVNN